MTPQEIILALAIQLAETTVERDTARNEARQLRAALDQSSESP